MASEEGLCAIPEHLMSKELENAIKVGDFDLFERIFKEGHPIDWQILYFVAQYGNVKMAEFLISNGCEMHNEICYEASSYAQLDFLKWCETRKFLKNIDECIDIAQTNLESLVENDLLEPAKQFIKTIKWLKLQIQQKKINKYLKLQIRQKKINKLKKIQNL